MKKASRVSDAASDDLRPEYDFDYSKAKPNPYAARLKGRIVTVVLDPDVARAFPTSESVNRTLRAAIATVPRRASVTARKARRPSRATKK